MPRMDRIGKTKTKIYESDGYTFVRYITTAVVKFNDDRIILNSGGWRTMTTKTRMNQAAYVYGLPYSVYQRGGRWFVYLNGKHDKPFLFYDWIELLRSPSGKLGLSLETIKDIVALNNC